MRYTNQERCIRRATRPARLATTIVATICIATALVPSPAAAVPAAATAGDLLAATAHGTQTAGATDGRNGFDFLFGTWQWHLRILRHRLRNSHEWYRCEGSSVARPLMGGSGNLEDGELRCPNRDVAVMTLRLYNAATHQWSIYWGTAKAGLVMPPQVGRFDGHGDGAFFADDTQEGQRVIVRYKWTLPSADHPHFEQAFSTDHGRTWETNWICDYTRA